MLNSSMPWQSYNGTVLRKSMSNGLLPPDNRVVSKHCSDHNDNQPDVDFADPKGNDAAEIFRDRDLYVDLPLRKIFAGARMALSTSGCQICFINHRRRIGRRQNVVNTMTACAIGNHLGSKLRSQAMIAIHVGSRAPGLHTERSEE